MDETVQPRSLKLTIKMKSSSISVNHSSAANPPNNVAGEANPPNNVSGEFNASATPTPCSPKNSSQDQSKISSPEAIGNNMAENDENQSPDNSQYQLVLYDPPANGGQNETEPPVPIVCHGPHPFPNQTPRVFPSVGAFTVQCAICFKWRLIPTQERYEEIREHIIDQPFSCETAREWRPDITCEDAPDIVQDGSRLWAIDKPSIAKPPPGWQRILRIRAEGGSKFADVYYESPSKKRLRSTIEVQRYLDENPQYAGISSKQFSFQIPRPLQENYVRKRPARVITDDANDHGVLVPTQVEPISWASPNVDADSQLTGTPLFKPEVQSAKKRKSSSSKKKNNGDISCDQNVVNLD